MQVPFHGRATRGWILGAAAPHEGRTLRVRARVSPVRVFDERLLDLARWVADRYVAPLASVLGRLAPPRVVSEEDGWTPTLRAVVAAAAPSDPVRWSGYRNGDALRTGVVDHRGLFVLRPAPDDEARALVDLVLEALGAGRRAIILVPEAEPMPASAAAVLDAVGERAAAFSGGSKRARYRRWLEIAGGAYDVVVGTRPAVFAPLRDVGLIAVARESHPAHREDRSPYFHVRDVAVARAGIDDAACVLSALAPSVESSTLDAVRIEPIRRRWPPVEIVRPGPEGRAPRLTAALRDARRGFLYAPLPGAGIAQVCRRCRAPAACASCGGTLREEEGVVRCIVCGGEGVCASCGARAFGLRRGGAERVEAWAGRIAHVPVRAADTERDGVGVLRAEEVIVVGGPGSVRDVGPLGLDLVGILDADLAARRPGIGAQERSLATWFEAAAWAAPAPGRPGGRVIVQASDPGDVAVQSLVRGNPEPFHRAERAQREEGGFPVGAAVFRVTGTAELPPHLERLDPTTLLVSSASGRTVCLLALGAEAVERFATMARTLAATGVVDRVEAEPHL